MGYKKSRRLRVLPLLQSTGATTWERGLSVQLWESDLPTFFTCKLSLFASALGEKMETINVTYHNLFHANFHNQRSSAMQLSGLPTCRCENVASWPIEKFDICDLLRYLCRTHVAKLPRIVTLGKSAVLQSCSYCFRNAVMKDGRILKGNFGAGMTEELCFTETLMRQRTAKRLSKPRAVN